MFSVREALFVGWQSLVAAVAEVAGDDDGNGRVGSEGQGRR